MLSLFLQCCISFERSMTYEGVSIKYGIDQGGFAYFGWAEKNRNAVNFSYTGHVDLPEAIVYRNKTIVFKMIKELAFANTKIKSISLPATLQWIARSAFENCTVITSIDASHTNLSMIDRLAFRNCLNLRVFKIPSTVYAIGRSAFENTPIISIANVNYTLIEDFAFSNNSEIVEVDLSASSLMVIGTSLFENCTRLTKIVLPKTVYWIKSNAFARTKIFNLELPQNIQLVHRYVFCGCQSITVANLENYPMKCVADGLYCNCTSLERVILPKMCYWIGPYAFYNTKIHEIQIPNECHTLGAWCFGKCSMLTKIDISETKIEELPNGIFYNCTALKTFKNTPNIKVIGAYALFNTQFTDIGLLRKLEKLDSNSFTNTKIEKVDMINASIKEIPPKLFYRNKYIQEVNLSNYTRIIGDYVFAETNFKTMIMPFNISKMGEGVFQKCKNLVFLFMNTTRILELKAYSFEECPELVTVRVPRYLNTVGKACFKNCPNLECVFGSKRLRMIHAYAFYNCTSIHEVDFTKTQIQYIEESAFENCLNLTRFVMCYSTLGTGPRAFANTKLKYFEFYHNIGTFCFSGCTDLRVVNMSRSPITMLNSAIFDGCTKLEIVHLPRDLTFIGKSVFRGCKNLRLFFFSGTKDVEFAKLPVNSKVYVTEKYNYTSFASLPVSPIPADFNISLYLK